VTSVVGEAAGAVVAGRGTISKPWLYAPCRKGWAGELQRGTERSALGEAMDSPARTSKSGLIGACGVARRGVADGSKAACAGEVAAMQAREGIPLGQPPPMRGGGGRGGGGAGASKLRHCRSTRKQSVSTT